MSWSRRATVPLLASVLVGLLAVPPAGAADLYSATASARGSALPRLAAAEAVAQSSASAQANATSLFHTNLSGLLGPCNAVAETVGRGPDVSSIFQAFRQSGSHWSIITSSKWTSMGAGAATGADGLLYVSLVFCQGAGGGGSASPSPSPRGGTGAGTARTAAPAPPPIVHHAQPELRRGDLLTGQSIGLFDPASASWSLTNGKGVRTFSFGAAGDVPLTCDWNGDGVDTVAVYRPSDQTFHLKMSNEPGAADLRVQYGDPGDVPICGDWNGDGVDAIGVYRPSQGTFHLRRGNSPEHGDLVFALDAPGEVPVVGDWNGDGVDTVGVHDPATGRVLLLLGNGSVFEGDFGNPGDRLLAGDWNGDGVDTLGVFRPSEATFHLSHGFGTEADRVVAFGHPDAAPVSGWWHPPFEEPELPPLPD